MINHLPGRFGKREVEESDAKSSQWLRGRFGKRDAEENSQWLRGRFGKRETDDQWLRGR